MTLTLTCRRCGESKAVEDRPVDGMRLEEWWASVGGLCSACRSAGLDVSPRKLTRSEDPSTSQSAAAGLGRSTHRRRLLEAFAERPVGLTFAEAGTAAGLSEPSAWRRTSDLLNAGYIETIPHRSDVLTRRLPSGKLGRVYRITEGGAAALDGREPPRRDITPLSEDKAVELILDRFPGSEVVEA